MPAQQQHYITTAYYTGTDGPCAVGTVVCFTNVATDRVTVATTANLATYTQNPMGISLTAADDNFPSAEIQQVGFVPNSVTGLGAGAAGDVCVNASGRLARGSSPLVVGQCDLEGNALVNFAGVGVGGGGGATPGGANGSIQYNNAGALGGVALGNVGSVLRTTGATTSAFGQLDLAAADAITGLLPLANLTPGANGEVLTSTGGVAAWGAAAAGFTAGGDLSGTSSSQQVEAISGNGGTAIIRATAAILAFVTAAVSPSINQTQNTTNGATGQTMTVQAQNATGTGATGGQLALSSGTGTSSAGNVNIQCGGSTILSCQPTVVAITPAFCQFGATTVNPTFRQATDATNGITGDTLTIQAQNATGTTSIGGNLILTSGTGTSTNGIVEIQVGTSPRLQLGNTAFALGDILAGNGTMLIRRAKGSANTYLRVNSGGTDIEYGTIAAGHVSATNTQVAYGAGGVISFHSGFTYDGAGRITLTAGASIGASNIASTGTVRFSTASTLVWRNTGNTADLSLITTNANDDLVFGQLTGSQYGNTLINNTTATAAVFQDNSVFRMRVTGTDLQMALPLAGCLLQSVGLRLKSLTIAHNSTSNLTLSATQYENPFLIISGAAGGSFNVVAPSATGTMFIVYNANSSQLTFGDTAGSGVVILSSAMKLVIHDGNDYRTLT